MCEYWSCHKAFIGGSVWSEMLIFLFAMEANRFTLSVRIHHINQPKKIQGCVFSSKDKFSNLGYYAGEKPPPPVILTSPNKVKVPGELVLLKIISCHIFYNLHLVLTFVLLIIDRCSSYSFTVTYSSILFVQYPRERVTFTYCT